MGTSYFTDFQPEELDVVLSMPYRVGVWISRIDDVANTGRDDAREGMTLENTLGRIGEKAGKGSFVATIISEILAHKDVWPLWDEMAGTAPNDLPKALALVDDRLPLREAALYRKSIFHIAKRVAMAASEGADAHEDLSTHMFGGKLIAKVTDWVAARADDTMPENISGSEKEALGRLLQLLKNPA